jgi:hypothetical protein
MNTEAAVFQIVELLQRVTAAQHPLTCGAVLMDPIGIIYCTLGSGVSGVNLLEVTARIMGVPTPTVRDIDPIDAEVALLSEMIDMAAKIGKSHPLTGTVTSVIGGTRWAAIFLGRVHGSPLADRVRGVMDDLNRALPDLTQAKAADLPPLPDDLRAEILQELENGKRAIAAGEMVSVVRGDRERARLYIATPDWSCGNNARRAAYALASGRPPGAEVDVGPSLEKEWLLRDVQIMHANLESKAASRPRHVVLVIGGSDNFAIVLAAAFRNYPGLSAFGELHRMHEFLGSMDDEARSHREHDCDLDHGSGPDFDPRMN